MHFHITVVADDDKLVAAFNGMKATPAHFGQKYLAPDFMINAAN